MNLKRKIKVTRYFDKFWKISNLNTVGSIHKLVINNMIKQLNEKLLILNLSTNEKTVFLLISTL